MEIRKQSSKAPLLSREYQKEKRPKHRNVLAHFAILKSKKAIIFYSIVAVVILVIVGLRYLNGNQLKSLVDDSGVFGQEALQTEPGFKTFGSVTNSDKGKFNPDRKVFTFQENIYDTTLVVSQQLIPEELKNSENNIEKLALSFNGSQSINRLRVQDNIAYLVGLSNGKQRLVTSTEELLIFVESPKKLSTQQWSEYINQLVKDH